jgi:hypothetical protein
MSNFSTLSFFSYNRGWCVKGEDIDLRSMRTENLEIVVYSNFDVPVRIINPNPVDYRWSGLVLRNGKVAETLGAIQVR